MRFFMRAPGRIQFVHRATNRRKQKTQRMPQPLAANAMAAPPTYCYPAIDRLGRKGSDQDSEMAAQ